MSRILHPQDWSFPIPIAYGPGRLRDMAGFCARAGLSAPLIVTDRRGQTLPFITRLKADLEAGGLRAGLFADVSPNPRDTEIAAGKAAFLAGGHDGVIAIGGGSGMDAGKAIALVARSEADLWAFEFEQTPPAPPAAPGFPPLITVPTTAGTGAETESTAMVTDTARGMKWCVWHPDLKPCLAVLDPELTRALPADLTAWTGLDAMIHAIEGYCVPGFHPLCDGMAVEGLGLVSGALRQAVAEPDDMEARARMLVGSCLAGISFLKGLGLVHAISHMVGAEYDTQHGLTNAILLPGVLRFNAAAIAEKVPALSHAVGLETRDFPAFDAWICAELDALNIPPALSDIGVPADCAARIANKALQDSAAGTNPRPATQDELELLIRDMITRGR